jgi:UDP-N-acetylmuramoylalanine--D-glutamate ligase
LNLTPDHLDRYATVEDYGNAKLRLARKLGPDDVMVVNADDEFFARAGEKRKQQTRVLTFSARTPNADAFVDDTDLVALGERYPIAELNLIGRHNLGNALAAILLLRGPDLADAATVRAALRAFRPLPHRMQLVAAKRGVRFYDDSKATNVDSVVAGLDGFPMPFVLVAGGRDKGGSYAPLVRALTENSCRAVVLIGEAADKIDAAIAGAVPTLRARSMEQAVELAIVRTERGDAVVLSPACSSYDMFKNYEHRGDVFKECVEALTTS